FLAKPIQENSTSIEVKDADISEKLVQIFSENTEKTEKSFKLVLESIQTHRKQLEKQEDIKQLEEAKTAVKNAESAYKEAQEDRQKQPQLTEAGSKKSKSSMKVVPNGTMTLKQSRESFVIQSQQHQPTVQHQETSTNIDQELRLDAERQVNEKLAILEESQNKLEGIKKRVSNSVERIKYNLKHLKKLEECLKEHVPSNAAATNSFTSYEVAEPEDDTFLASDPNTRWDTMQLKSLPQTPSKAASRTTSSSFDSRSSSPEPATQGDTSTDESLISDGYDFVESGKQLVLDAASQRDSSPPGKRISFAASLAARAFATPSVATIASAVTNLFSPSKTPPTDSTTLIPTET
ncbi:MAG: hypothetical protein V4591_06950, partial [Bdellovibrionota bacterium]